jgi:hypothetical protein
MPFPTRPGGSPMRFEKLAAGHVADRGENAPVTSPGANRSGARHDRVADADHPRDDDDDHGRRRPDD